MAEEPYTHPDDFRHERNHRWSPEGEYLGPPERRRPSTALWLLAASGAVVVLALL